MTGTPDAMLPRVPLRLSAGPLARHGKRSLRLYRSWRRVRRIGPRQPAERRSEEPGAGTGGGPGEPSVVADSDWLRQADPKPSSQLALFVGARRGDRPAPHSDPTRQASRRLVVDQRHGVRARPIAGLRHLGPARQSGWSYREVLPIFKEMESYQGQGDDEYRGRRGPLRVSENNETGALYDALIKAAGEVGIAYTQDYNGARQDGIGMTQTTIRGGRRMSTAVCYLDPARARPNLTILANALTEGLLFEGKRCVGVRYTVQGQQREARASREVVVSAGSINSPQLLELSGIGQPERLKAVGIEVRHELKGVGENLRDHYSPRMKWTVPPALGMTYNDKMRGLGRASCHCRSCRAPAAPSTSCAASSGRAGSRQRP